MIAERSRSLSSEPNPVGRASRFARADESARDASGHRVGEPSGVPPQRHRLSVVMQAPSTFNSCLFILATVAGRVAACTHDECRCPNLHCHLQCCGACALDSRLVLLLHESPPWPVGDSDVTRSMLSLRCMHPPQRGPDLGS